MSHTPLVDTYPQYPFEISHGKGAYVYDTNNTEYLDLYGGHAVCGIGHSHPHHIASIAKQAERLTFYSNLTKLDIRTRAADALLEFADSHLNSVFFCNSGAEANENALKLALQLTGRKQLIGTKGGWHGRTTMCMSITDDAKWHEKLGDWRGNTDFIQPNNTDDLVKITEKTAGVIVEPIQSIGGVTVMTKEYLKALSDRCKKVGALLVLDEIQTGAGRLGVPYVNRHWGVDADMSTTAKSIGGGFPVAAILMSDDVAKEIALGDLGTTYGGAPLAATAVLATIEIIKEENLMSAAKAFGDKIKSDLSELNIVEEVRGEGCLLGLKLTTEAKPVVGALRDKHQILTGVSGVKEVMRLLPPYNTPIEVVNKLKNALEEIQSEVTS